MLISENYLLMTLEETEEKNYVRSGVARNECLAGALIMDLIFKGKLSVEGKKLKIIDTSPTGDELLDEILTIFKESTMVHKIRYWVGVFSITYKLKIKELILRRLDNENILKFEKKSISRIFVKFGYTFIRPEVRSSLIEQIRKIFIDNLEPDIYLLCLLMLLKISRLIRVHIPKEFRKFAGYHIDELILYGKYDPKYLEMISSIKKAIKYVLSGKAAF